MNNIIVKLSDNYSGKSANVSYQRNNTPRYTVEYYQNTRLVNENSFNTQFEATQSAQNFLGDDNGKHFNLF